MGNARKPAIHHLSMRVSGGAAMCSGMQRSFQYNICPLGPQINVRMQPCIDSRTSKPIYVTKKKKVTRIEREGFIEKVHLREL